MGGLLIRSEVRRAMFQPVVALQQPVTRKKVIYGPAVHLHLRIYGPQQPGSIHLSEYCWVTDSGLDSGFGLQVVFHATWVVELFMLMTPPPHVWRHLRLFSLMLLYYNSWPIILGPHLACLCVFVVQVKRSFGLCSLQLTYFDEENEEVTDCFVVSLIWLFRLFTECCE